VKLYKAGKFSDALPLFQEVAQSTASPNAFLYIGYCESELGHDAVAYEAFTTAIDRSAQDATRYAETKEAATAELTTLNARVARLVVSVTDIPPELAVQLDGAPLEEKKLGSYLVLKPGAHHVEARGKDVEPITRDVDVAAGESKTIALTFHAPAKPEPVASPPPPPPAGDPKLRTYGFIAGGVGVAGLAVFAITGAMTKSTYDDLSKQCSAGCTDSAHKNDIDRGKTLQTTANVSLIIGGVGLAASGALLYLGYTGKHESNVTVAVAPGVAAVGYGGRF
jgi:hypothetical protein